jgi:hypothetical protein
VISRGLEKTSWLATAKEQISHGSRGKEGGCSLGGEGGGGGGGGMRCWLCLGEV